MLAHFLISNHQRHRSIKMAGVNCEFLRFSFKFLFCKAMAVIN